MRVAVVYGRSPSGHASAAAALENEFRARGLECFRVSAAADINPVLGPFLDASYIRVLEFCPWLWRAVYDRRAVLPVAALCRALYWRVRAAKVLAAIERIKPDVIVCTHAAPLSILALGKKRGAVRTRLVACPTDYDIHSFWMSPEVDLYLASSSLAAKRLAAAGIDRSRIAQTGIPIDPVFSQSVDKTRARRDLRLDPRGVVFLLSGGSRGLGRVKEAAVALLERFPRAEVVALCGENEMLWSALRSAAQPRLKAYLGADKGTVRRLMAAADALIGKAGGVTLAEASAAGLPMIFFGVLPGQEERNARLWLSAGAAREARSTEELLRIVSALVSKRSERVALIKRAAIFCRPRAGWAAADAVLGLGTFAMRPVSRASAAGECLAGAL
ncbi:MAG TPA: glycosyltransferase [Elusimicrobiota bacterium]|nr:glycosyltransferase [Elusimicrobiota bacterium]